MSQVEPQTLREIYTQIARIHAVDNAIKSGLASGKFMFTYWPMTGQEAIIKFTNTRGADKIIYGGYFPAGLELTRILSEMEQVPSKDEVWPKFLRDNAAKVLGLSAPL